MKKISFLRTLVLAAVFMPTVYVCAQSKLDKQVLMTIGNTPVTVKEFTDVYAKNNLTPGVRPPVPRHRTRQPLRNARA